MANEQMGFHVGWLTLSTLDDARRSSITGTTLNGPNGSGQFYWVYGSSLNALQVRLGSSNVTPSPTQNVLGILQNTPGPGDPCDICMLGVSKVIAGSTSIVPFQSIQQSSAPTAGLSGLVVPYSTTAGNGAALGFALEAPTSTGAVFTAFINVTGGRST